MNEYRVWLVNNVFGEGVTVHAGHCEISQAGELRFTAGGQQVEAFARGVWARWRVEYEGVGTASSSS